MPKDPANQARERIDEARRTGAAQLDLSWLNLTTLPDRLWRLPALTSLALHNNRLRALPENLGQLTNLTSLHLDMNQLASLPESLGDLSRLTTLSLHINHLASLPESLGRLTNLTTLKLGDNRLSRLPESIGHLTHLVELTLDRNHLSELPDSLARLTALRVLLLHDNPLDIPAEILGPTWDEVLAGRATARPVDILAYYFRASQQPRPLNEARLIVLGQGEVGKTSLVNRLVHQRFDPAESTTHGINITHWPLRLGDEDVTLHLWDFGGQEIMHATHQFFLTQRSLYLVVLNGRPGKEDEEAEYWLQLVENFAGDAPVIVVLNKMKQHRYAVDEPALRNRHRNIRGFVATDCAECWGLDDLRRKIEAEVDALPHLRASFPVNWFRIKDRLTRMQENYLGYEKYEELCREMGESDPAAQEQLAGYLHALGIALNFREDSRLSDKHVLNPRWVTGGIYAILNAPSLAAHAGILHPADLGEILDRTSYPGSMHPFLLDLMRKFDLCFPLPDELGRYLVPELLSKQAPAEAHQFDPAACLNFEYRYKTLPEGLLPRFLARTHWHSTGRLRRRLGVVLGFDGSEALVLAEPASRRVLIRVAGRVERRPGLLALIRCEFDRLHAAFKSQPPEAWVPVPGHPGAAVPYADLLLREKRGRATIEQVIGDDVLELSVAELLHGVDLPEKRQRSQRPPVRVFVSYAHKDETHKATLGGHLLPLIQEGLIHWWDDRHLRPGDDWAGQIDQNLESAEVILLLVTRNFLASRYCCDIETPRALARHVAGQARVVPIILDASDTSGRAFMDYQVLPTDNRPIHEPGHWPDPNDAWRQVVAALRDLVRR